MRKVVSVFLIITLLFSYSALAIANERVDTPYDELQPVLLDVSVAVNLSSEISALCADANNVSTVYNKIIELRAMVEEARTWSYYYMNEFHRNPSKENNLSYQQTSDIFTQIDVILSQCVIGIMASDCQQAAVLYAEEFLSPQQRELIASGDTVKLGLGQKIITEYTEKYYAINPSDFAREEDPAHAYALAVGALYLDYINEMNKIVGESTHSVAELCRIFYGIEYTAEEDLALKTAVKEILVPTYRKVYHLLPRITFKEKITGNQWLGSVEDVSNEHFPFLTEAIEYMKTYGYYQVEGDNPTAVMQVVPLPILNQFYLYAPLGNDSMWSRSGLIHELGHYNYAYSYESLLEGATLESKEVHSQALELLFSNHYEQLFGDDYVNHMDRYKVIDTLSAVLEACVIDEFQKQAFEKTPDTPEKLCELYGKLLGEYGRNPANKNYWANISHLFRQPFYYLSYGTSALASLQIWAISQKNEENAVSLYQDFLEKSTQATKNIVAFPAILERAGMLSLEDSAYAVSHAIEESMLDVGWNTKGNIYTSSTLVNGSFEKGNLTINHHLPEGDQAGGLGWYTTAQIPETYINPDAHGKYFIEVVPKSNAEWYYKYVSTDGTATQMTDSSYYIAPEGDRFAELNAESEGALYQDIKTVPGEVIKWEMWHRGRNGEDTMQVHIGNADGLGKVDTLSLPVQKKVYTGSNDTPSITDGLIKTGIPAVLPTVQTAQDVGWVKYWGFYTVPENQHITRLAFESVGTANGDNTNGNMIDNISFQTLLSAPNVVVSDDTANISLYCTLENVELYGRFDDETPVLLDVASSEKSDAINNGNYLRASIEIAENTRSFSVYAVDTKGTKTKDDDVSYEDYAVSVLIPTSRYTVNFDANGGTVSPVTLTTSENSKLDSLPVSTHNGSYHFDGWYTEPTGGTKVTTDTVFTENATIYAHWIYNGGSSSSSGNSYDYCAIKISLEGEGIISPDGGINKTLNVLKKKDQIFTITPKDGYVISDVLIDGKSVGKVKTYTFKDVRQDHAIKVIFRSGSELVVQNPFTDIVEDDWFFDEVLNAYKKGIMTGTSDTTFSPSLATNRAMIATIIHRLENKPESSVTHPFVDVSEHMWYTDAISWCFENDIINGYDNGKYGPNETVTREQIASILYRYAIYKEYDISKKVSLDSYIDGNQTSGYAKEAMQWAVANSLFSGMGNGRLNPKGHATRAETVTILNRFFSLFGNK